LAAPASHACPPPQQLLHAPPERHIGSSISDLRVAPSRCAADLQAPNPLPASAAAPTLHCFRCLVSLNGIRVDANLCDLQNIGLPEDSSLTSFSFSLALFSCLLLPHYFQELYKDNWRNVERETKFEMADRRDWGGGGDDREESTLRMIDRIWESLIDIQRRMDQQAPVPPVAVPPGDGETVPIAPVPPGVEVPFVAPVPPPPPVLLAEEPVTQVEKFLRLQPPTYTGGPNPDTEEHWVHEIERVFATMRCPIADKVVLAAYQLRGFALEW
ncbi:hypothetical protein Taro_022960, partial [Colocasia esculenta]|nr:hypothetical protein [Colocasia esculenta]